MISHHHSSLMPQEAAPPPAKITTAQVRSLFDLWNDALHTGDPYTVAARYSKDAVLLPTLSDKARYTTDEIADYFVGFLKKKPDGKILEGNIKIGPNWAQDAGKAQGISKIRDLVCGIVLLSLVALPCYFSNRNLRVYLCRRVQNSWSILVCLHI